MRIPRWFYLVLTVGVALGCVRLFLTMASAASSGSVSGFVVAGGEPVSSARVRVRATDNLTFTNNQGAFILNNIHGSNIEIAAWADGYYIANTFVTPTVEGVTLTLRSYHTTNTNPTSSGMILPC